MRRFISKYPFEPAMAMSQGISRQDNKQTLSVLHS